MHHVILGAGPAGVTAAETLRAADRNASITLVSGEGGAPYSRMAIPYLLQGAIEEQGTQLRQAAGHYERLAITVRPGRAGGLEPRAKRLFLTGGEALSYDRLLIATGASPVVPQMDGANLPGVHSCWTLADAREILARAEKGAPVVLVGAGFIGTIVLEALHARGCDLTVVEVAPRMVARMMDETAAGMLKRWCEAKGVRVLTATRVERISQVGGNGASSAHLRVALSSGATIPAALVVLAAGVRSNVSFLVGAGIATDRGIRVGDHLETSAPDVYAAGDCCEARDLSTGRPDVLAIQPVAVEHGRIAALNMAGRPTVHRGSLNMNVLDTMGLVTASFGAWEGVGGGSSARAVDEAGLRYTRLEFDGDRLVGTQSVGLPEHIGIARGLIQTRTRLGAWRARLMKAPERLGEAYVALAQGSGGQGWSGPSTKTPRN
jgi:NAD(P)H-nitrite reductase large subunit